MRPCLAAFMLVAASPAIAQVAPSAPVPVPMEEQVLVQLVQLPFVATDRQGRPVIDLNKDEIRVKVRGQEPKIIYLERMAIQEKGTTESIPDVRLFLDAPGGWSEPVRASASSDFLAIVVDNENDSPVRRDEALEQLATFLDTDLDAELRIAVFSYSGTLKLELPFTADRDAAKSSVRLSASREGRPRVDPRARIRKLVDRFDDCVVRRGDFVSVGDPRCIRDASNEYVGEMRPRSSDLVLALEGVVQYLGGVQGRKGVFVLSHGFPIDLSPVLLEAARGTLGNTDSLSDLQRYLGFGDDPRVRMDRLIESLIRQRITMTFVDRALPPSADTGASVGRPTAPGSSPMRAEYDAAVADMEQIAVSSGGMHIHATALGEGLRKAIKARDGSYELGLQFSAYLEPHRLSKISLDCTRRGVKIHSRRGVYAAPAQAEQTLRGRFVFGKGRQLDGERAPGIHQPFALRVDPESIGYEVTDIEARSSFTLDLLVERASDGRPLAETYHFVDHAYDKKAWVASDRAPMTLSGWVDLPPGEYTLEAWVRNVRSGREGVIRQSVNVPHAPQPTPPVTTPPRSGC